LGAPVGLSLTGGVLLAGAVPMAALALEGREFGVLGFLQAVIAWQRAPRHYTAAPGTPPGAGYHVPETIEPQARTGRRSRRSAA